MVVLLICVSVILVLIFFPEFFFSLIYGFWEAWDHGYVPIRCVVVLLVHPFPFANGFPLKCSSVSVTYFLILIFTPYWRWCTQDTWHLSHDGVSVIIMCDFWGISVADFTILFVRLFLINKILVFSVLFWCFFVVILIIFFLVIFTAWLIDAGNSCHLNGISCCRQIIRFCLYLCKDAMCLI